MKKIRFQKKNTRFFLLLLFTFCTKFVSREGPYLMRIDNSYMVGKMYKNVSTDSVRVRKDLSIKFGCPLLSGQETHMPSPVDPYILYPIL